MNLNHKNDDIKNSYSLFSLIFFEDLLNITLLLSAKSTTDSLVFIIFAFTEPYNKLIRNYYFSINKKEKMEAQRS